MISTDVDAWQLDTVVPFDVLEWRKFDRTARVPRCTSGVLAATGGLSVLRRSEHSMIDEQIPVKGVLQCETRLIASRPQVGDATMNDDEITSAAELLFAIRRSDSLFAGFPGHLRPGNEVDAYRIQDRLLELFARADGLRFAGHKIGSTTPVMQKYLGIDSPCAGRLRLSLTHQGRGSFSHRAEGTLGVECEIAVRLKQDLSPARRPYDRAKVMEAVGTCMAAIEVVEDRYLDWRSLDTPTLVADNFFNTGAVLGQAFDDFDPAELDEVTATMTIDDTVVGQGRGSDVLGHPLDALVWLANNASGRGMTLCSDEVVLLGSLVETHWVEPGSMVQIDNSAFGRVEAVFL